MPMIIQKRDNEAILLMVDSNLQRENLLPGEKAWAYKMKLDAMRRKEERPAAVQITLKKDKLQQYFPRSYTQKQIEEVIFSLLQKWKIEKG